MSAPADLYEAIRSIALAPTEAMMPEIPMTLERVREAIRNLHYRAISEKRPDEKWVAGLYAAGKQLKKFAQAEAAADFHRLHPE